MSKYKIPSFKEYINASDEEKLAIAERLEVILEDYYDIFH